MNAKLLPILSIAVLLAMSAPSPPIYAASLEDAIQNSGKMFFGHYKTACFEAESGEKPPLESHIVRFKQYDGEVGEIYLVGYQCDLAAYNSSQAWFLTDSDLETSPISFSRPVVDFKYDDDDSRTLKSWAVVGMESVRLLSGSSYDPKTQQISTFHKWRGLGDAHESLVYRLKDDRFVLSTFDVDPTYDEKINAITIVDYSAVTQ